MPVRDIVLRATSHDMVGDETVELWLKRGAGAWALEQSAPVETDNPPFMDFEILGLDSGVDHVAQIRVFRDGRFRAGYIGSNPEVWPDQSRIEFIPGAEAAPAPTIMDAVWERTSAVAQQVTVTITPDGGSLDQDIDVYRDGVFIGTIDAPHVGDVDFIDADPPIATDVVYTARHRLFTLDGILSDPWTRWVGPNAPEDLIQIGDVHNWYGYEVQWTGLGIGENARVRDDWPLGVPTNRTLTGATSFLIDGGLEKDSAEAEGGATVTTNTDVEVRFEVTSFTVTDVSKWSSVSVTVDMATDETAH